MRVALLVVVSLIGLAAAPSLAQADGPDRLITVTGQGTVVASPDAAEVNAGVVTTGDTAAQALTENTKRMTEMIAGLKALGVAEREMRTSNFSVTPVYERDKFSSGGGPKIIGYRVGNNVEVRLRDVADVGRVLDRLVALGANSINNVQFVVSDRYEKMQAALADAVTNARERAALMADAAGARLGPVVELRETALPAPRPVFAMRASSEAADVPIAGGEETLQVTVQATFALE